MPRALASSASRVARAIVATGCVSLPGLPSDAPGAEGLTYT
ncbi:MAG: hypothetical protein ABIX28_16755 [Vicinamibacterales bacterium]